MTSADTAPAADTPDLLPPNPDEAGQRRLTGPVAYVFYILAIGFVLFHLYVLNIRAMDPWVFRSIHLSLASAIGFALYAGGRRPGSRVQIIDWICIAASLYCAYYIYTNLDKLLFRAGVMPTRTDYIVALVGVLLVLELTRRTSGWTLPILALVFVAYAFLGPYLPGMLTHRGYSAPRFFTYIYGLDGVFGVTLGVSSTYLVLFIAFAAFLEKSGVGDYFVKFAYSLAGSARGGPAKVAVLASGLMGMISGTSAGNVVATGSFTIPLMRRVGYNPRFAGATEAVASTGGQIMPPIMGAGAFIMAEVTGIPYSRLMLAAIIPAVLYFASVYFMVDHEAAKTGMLGVPRRELPVLRDMLAKAYLFLPVVVLIWTLLSGYSVVRAGTLGLITSLVLGLLNRERPMNLRSILDALELGARNSIGLISICACAGIIVGVIALTGVGLRFSSFLLAIAQGNQLLALVLAMVIAIVLGTGMPTTAAYAVAASVVAPGLIRMGMAPIVAHMFVFYFAVISAITPPVALAAYAASGIAGTDPMKTSLQAFRLGLAAFIVPFMFVYGPSLLLQAEPLRVAVSAVTALIGVYMLASAVQGWFLGPLSLPLRVVSFISALMFIESSYVTDGIAILLALVVYAVQRRMAVPASVQKQTTA